MSRPKAEPKEPAILMDVADVAHALGIGARTLWRWISAGTFPPPDLSMGAKVRRWKRETVEGWIERHTTGEGRAA